MIRKLKDLYYDFNHGIPNIFKWFKVIWKDRDCDQYYIYAILYKKFEHMEKFHKYHSHLVRGDRTAKELMIAKNLSKRLMESDYLSNALIDYEKKYGDNYDMEFEPSKIDEDGKVKLYTMVDKRPLKQQEDFSKAGKHSDYMEKQDKDMLFDYIKKHI
jgi:hypothetical protein